ncbi:MAG TPA: HAMP domain-containing histidine kinase [Treponema sp.]|nr:HAMP domain-containing histidine kinase [Treponema sp.]
MQYRMGNSLSFRRTIFVLIMIAVASIGVLFVFHTANNHRARIEYRAFQIMTGIVERYGTEESFTPELWSSLIGFGLYNNFGLTLYRFGSAPASILERNAEPGVLNLSEHTVTMIRKLGFVPSINGPSLKFRRKQSLNERTNRIFPHEQGIKKRTPPAHIRFASTVFIEVNVAQLIRQSYIEIGVLIAVFFSLLVAVPLLFRYSERIIQYRDREQRNLNLVQLGEAARTLAHEIKNPLGVIKVQCATLQRVLPEAFHKNIFVIGEETQRLVTMTDRLRGFLQNNSGNPQSISVPALFEQYGIRYGDALRIKPIENSSLVVLVDPDFLVQMLDNLIVNAKEAVLNGSSVPELFCTEGNETASFSILDCGTGVLPEDKNHIFDLFFTKKIQGSGIGLALVKRLAELSGGSTGYRSRKEGGSIFWITVPLAHKGDIS